MAKAWSDVAASPEFQSLGSDQQEAARVQYFRDVVAPQVSSRDIDAAFAQFNDSTKPTLIGRARKAIKSAIGGLADVGKSAAPGPTQPTPEAIDDTGMLRNDTANAPPTINLPGSVLDGRPAPTTTADPTLATAADRLLGRDVPPPVSDGGLANVSPTVAKARNGDGRIATSNYDFDTAVRAKGATPGMRGALGIMPTLYKSAHAINEFLGDMT